MCFLCLGTNLQPSDSLVAAVVSTETQTDRRRVKSPTFIVGDSTDEDSDADTSAAALTKGEMLSVETQTEEPENMKNVEPRPPRPVQECSAILKQEVSMPCDYVLNYISVQSAVMVVAFCLCSYLCFAADDVFGSRKNFQCPFHLRLYSSDYEVKQPSSWVHRCTVLIVIGLSK